MVSVNHQPIELWDVANHYALCASCNAYQCVKFEADSALQAKRSARSDSEGKNHH